MIPGLDGLRAVAFLLVFAFHTNYLDFGWAGVQLFFVLSGFLITAILIEMKRTLPAKAYYVKFYGRRFLRIFPLYYFYLFLMLGLAYWLYVSGYRINKMLEFFDQLPFALTYLYNFLYASVYFIPSDFVTHFWSLSVEEQFYIFWPLVILLTPPSAYKKLFIAAIILGPVFRLIATFVYNSHAFPILNANTAVGIYPLPFSHIDAFGFGAFISQYKLPKARLQFFVLLLAVPLIGYGTQYLATHHLEYLSSLGYVFPMGNGFKHIWGYSLLNYFFAVTIYAVAREGLFNRFLESRWMKYLGRISYGMYVYHSILIFFALRIQDYIPLTSDQSQLLTALVSFIATLIVASISYALLEKPFLNLKDKFFATARNM
jgi:peptidoglycan/LPS O-acetylase OafA/YrhL